MARVVFLGTGGSFVSEKRACSGILVDDKLLDCGFGVLSNLRKARIDLDEINEIYITHTHSDHIGDFTGIIWAMQLEGRKKELNVFSSRKTARSLKRILELQSTPKDFVKFGLRFLEPEDQGINYCIAEHTVENISYKIKAGKKTVVYSGDTSFTTKLVMLAEKTDILIHESTFLEEQRDYALATKHSTTIDAARTALDSSSRMLLLTHISPFNKGREKEYLTEARNVFSNTEIASDFYTLEI